ncbi:MAG: DUF3014 domain-containing protein [Methylovulum sp.]|jgi:hypothetical protein|nr:DUF3014 domain-containing protein [Methylovulum sp.]MCF7997962.1 DUF3014 domain-containing protein [Methylovulum sp.]
MSRYDRTKARQSGRYSPKSNKIKEGMPYLSALFLILIAAVGGFFAGRYLLEEKSKPNTEIQSLVIPDQSPNMNVQPMLTESEPLENLPSLTHQPTLPNLDSSDEFARDIILQSAPGLAQWLQNGQIIKSYLQIINDFSQGLRLVKHMDFLKPDAPFAVESHQDHTVIAEQSYQRYNKLAQAINAIDASVMWANYRKLKPLIDQVYTTFSYPPEYTLDDLFIKAAAEILTAPIIEEPLVVVKNGAHYQYDDQQLESLNAVKKQMLRMGPENTRIIQSKIRLLVEEMSNLRD